MNGDGAPGAELVDEGLADLERGDWTIAALLVTVGAPRLTAVGVQVPVPADAPHHPELALYRAVGRIHPEDAHSRYNALIRRLVSYERELERRWHRLHRAESGAEPPRACDERTFGGVQGSETR